MTTFLSGKPEETKLVDIKTSVDASLCATVTITSVCADLTATVAAALTSSSEAKTSEPKAATSGGKTFNEAAVDLLSVLDSDVRSLKQALDALGKLDQSESACYALAAAMEDQIILLLRAQQSCIQVQENLGETAPELAAALANAATLADCLQSNVDNLQTWSTALLERTPNVDDVAIQQMRR